MAANKCFDSYTPVLSSTDYTLQQKQKNIYATVFNDSTLLGTGNPVKKNKSTYNNSISLMGGSECLSAAQSYDLLSNYTAGQELLQPTAVPVKYASWAGSLYSVNYAEHGVDSVVYATDPSWNNAVTDPSYVLFYDQCFANYDELNRPETWLHVVDVSFNSTDFYKQATNTFVPPCIPDDGS